MKLGVLDCCSGMTPSRAYSANSTRQIIISFAGDCTFGRVNGDNSSVRFPAVYAHSGESDYPFQLVKANFRRDDLTIVNFECTLTNAKKIANKQWHFKGDSGYTSIFKDAGIDAVSLANNHSHDYLDQGFHDTVANFDKGKVGILYQNHPFLAVRKGVQIIVIGDCTVVGENTTDIDGTPARVISEIKRYKRPNNIVIVFMHWGNELNQVPHQWQQSMGRSFIDSGADAVVGAHPHVLQGIEIYKGKCIAYSLGNFAFGGNSLSRNPQTAILTLNFRASAANTSFAGFSILPCLTTSSQFRNRAGITMNNYQPMPLDGSRALAIKSLLISRSDGLRNGVRRITLSNM